MLLQKSVIPGCYQIIYTARPDTRGTFVKTLQASVFAGMGLEFSWVESFYSVSEKNVLRGMHLQLAPADGAKLVACMQGEVLDVVLDLRKGSPAFGKTATFNLSNRLPSAVYIPSGVAHGFYVSDGPATLLYYMSEEYHPALDTGVLWNSFGFDWPADSPVLSARDQSFARFEQFPTPFVFSEHGHE